jgi:hydroxymethylglutaryl-CoA lyase
MLLKNLKPADLAIHAHDTYGQALANILVALDRGLETIDASIGGLGGCPYAPGAAGNVATEDVLYMLNGMDIETGVDIAKLVDCAYYISDALQRPPISKVAKALGRSSTHS